MSDPAGGAHFRRVRELFEEIAELDPTEREARLDALAASERAVSRDVRALLSADARAGDFLACGDGLGASAGEDGVAWPATHDSALARALEAVVDDELQDLRGQTVGDYRLIERLGRGGMGEVYLGERADGRFEQKVAVKLVRRGLDTAEILRRFARRNARTPASPMSA